MISSVSRMSYLFTTVRNNLLKAGLLPGLLLLSAVGFAQCKTFKLSDKGDTLNCVDMKDHKQGKWVVRHAELRGTPGYEEEGEYIDDLKDGIWRTYTLQGDVMSVQTYKWGMLDGTSHFYSLQGLEREENWRAIDPAKKYDTIDVPDLYNEGEMHEVVVKNEGQSMKHGRWTWYDPSSGFETKREDFFRDSAVNSLGVFGLSKNAKNPSDSSKTAKKVDKPAIVQEWEKKNAGKKKVTVRDGSVGY